MNLTCDIFRNLIFFLYLKQMKALTFFFLVSSLALMVKCGYWDYHGNYDSDFDPFEENHEGFPFSGRENPGDFVRSLIA